MIRLRHLAGVNPSTPEFDRLADDAEIPFVPLEAVWRSGVDASRRKSKAAALTGYTRFLEGDIVVPKITPTFQADRSTIASGIEGGVAAGTTELHVVRAARGVDGRYLRYLLSSRTFLRGGEAEMIGVAGQKRVPDEWIRNMPVHVTDYGTQRAIADYLDTETARIDALIAKKRGLLDLFKHRVDAWRYEAFAGIGRPTGIPSMPEVPLGWDVLRNKVVLQEVNDPSPDGNGEMLSVSHLTGVTPRREKNVNMFEAESTVGYKRVRPGDLVINTMWAWMGAAGVSRYNGIVSPAYGVYRFRSNRVLPEFYDVLVRSQAYIDEMTRFSRGVTSSRLRLYPEEFLALRCPVPQVEAQERLAANYRDQVVRFETLDRQLTHQIDLLVERRQALITAAVTAELEIPGMPA